MSINIVKDKRDVKRRSNYIKNILDTPKIYISGVEIRIEGYLNVAEYSENKIAVICKNKLVTLTGRSLEINAMDSEEILITGAVEKIELEARGRYHG